MSMRVPHLLLDGRWQCCQELGADLCDPWSSQYRSSRGRQAGRNRGTGGWSDAKLILQHLSTNVLRKSCQKRGIHTLWQADACKDKNIMR